MPVTIAKPKVPLIIAKSKEPSRAAVSKDPVQPGDVATPMAGAALVMSSRGQPIAHPEIKEMMNQSALDLYENIQKRDALESMLTMLAVSIPSASLDCLSQAALSSPGDLKFATLIFDTV